MGMLLDRALTVDVSILWDWLSDFFWKYPHFHRETHAGFFASFTFAPHFYAPDPTGHDPAFISLTATRKPSDVEPASPLKSSEIELGQLYIRVLHSALVRFCVSIDPAIDSQERQVADFARHLLQDVAVYVLEEVEGIESAEKWLESQSENIETAPNHPPKPSPPEKRKADRGVARLLSRHESGGVQDIIQTAC